MIIYICEAGSNGHFQAFTSKRDAEKHLREYNDAPRGEEPNCNANWLTITKHDVKTRRDIIWLLNSLGASWDDLY
jgi:hypothetical protein